MENPIGGENKKEEEEQRERGEQFHFLVHLESGLSQKVQVTGKTISEVKASVFQKLNLSGMPTFGYLDTSTMRYQPFPETIEELPRQAEVAITLTQTSTKVEREKVDIPLFRSQFIFF